MAGSARRRSRRGSATSSSRTAIPRPRRPTPCSISSSSIGPSRFTSRRCRPSRIIESRRGIRDFGAKRSNQVVIWETLMDAETLVLTANTETVYGDGLPRPEGRRTDRRGSPAEDARSGDGYACSDFSWTSARSDRTRARAASTSFSRRVIRARCRRVTSSSSRRPTASVTSCAASRWTGRPTRPWRS